MDRRLFLMSVMVRRSMGKGILTGHDFIGENRSYIGHGPCFDHWRKYGD